MPTTNYESRLAQAKVTDQQIRELRREAEQHGDLRQAMICVLALGGTGALEGAEPGTDAADLLREERTQEWAREACAGAIANAQAMAD